VVSQVIQQAAKEERNVWRSRIVLRRASHPGHSNGNAMGINLGTLRARLHNKLQAPMRIFSEDSDLRGVQPFARRLSI
jgi:hypothetical protein